MQDQEDSPGAVFRIEKDGVDNDDFCVWNGEKWNPSQAAMDAYWWDRKSRVIDEDEAKRLCEEWKKIVKR